VLSLNLPQVLIVSPKRPLADSGAAGRKKGGMLSSKGEMLPQFGADNAKIISLTQRRQVPADPFSGDSTTDARIRFFAARNRQK
jgi:hypothetical protein